MRIALYQMEVVPGNPHRAMEKIEAWIKTLSQIDIVVLPEMWNTSYTLTRLHELTDDEGEREIRFLQKMAKQHALHIVGGSIAVKSNGQHYNRSIIIDQQGEIIYQYDKIHLVPMLNEPDYLAAGHQFSTFELMNEKMGIIICYDLRFPELSRHLALDGAEIIYVVAEWPMERMAHFMALLKARAVENQCYIVACNTVGECEGTQFGGGSMIIDPGGEVLAQADAHEETVIVQVDIKQSEAIRQAIPVFKSRRTDLY
ncbi:carbon-nitrogen family hydrolase [Macrococcus hajekii]|uniref:Carbon-nitrogen family hydrolase n=1 Tax=Macrococcus hajekii TaxID=198482 RepID=A0A4V6PPN3_9STAP|nr:carbon-nitrogen family hydrolase [Macrococcus hajekii]TDM01334.1 carbon-nitrogen family hydrolase [Macrococcus hajekii]GGB10773.1 carbon-nitrogen hydrolase [Macrococcus hajekii]